MAGEKKDMQKEDSEYCRVKLDSLFRLKDSTKKLLYIIEEIQSKIHSSDTCVIKEDLPLPILNQTVSPSKLSDVGDTTSIKKLETDTKNLDLLHLEGLTKCPHLEKVDMILACSHADICNVFEDDSFIEVCIMWPNKYETFGDQITQNLAAKVLYRLAMIEEGRRYLNFNSKITNDIKKVLRKKAAHLESDTVEFLNSTLNLLSPSMAPHINATYYCKANEGMANKILNSLAHFRHYMTLEEVFTNLDLIFKLSDNDKAKIDLKPHLPFIFSLFKHLLMEYDNSDMNVIVAKIINRLMKKPTEHIVENVPITYIVSDTATEPINMKHEVNQIPSKKNITRTNRFAPNNKATRSRPVPSRNVGDWKSSRHNNINRSKKGLNSNLKPPFRP
ncbi:uncharacterized protein LOC126371272 isoform X2 [Pectinophora gossypiella]|nr:uncharacterized protein LOC126371272 isoform X2 [Pectinophora gossypiella]